ncbi:YopX family protein [Bacillus cereus]
MREIKFRAWIGESWVYSESISKDNDVWRILNHEDDNWWACLEPQQYTGLKDKNDKEIYEGDILKIVSKFELREDVQKQAVTYTEGFFSTDEWALFELLRNRKDGKQTFEVIGNIYENPELLEESK